MVWHSQFSTLPALVALSSMNHCKFVTMHGKCQNHVKYQVDLKVQHLMKQGLDFLRVMGQVVHPKMLGPPQIQIWTQVPQILVRAWAMKYQVAGQRVKILGQIINRA